MKWPSITKAKLPTTKKVPCYFVSPSTPHPCTRLRISLSCILLPDSHLIIISDDIHIATLTVAQTLAFALSTKTPGKGARLPGVRGKHFNEEVLNMLLRMLNIQHTAQTLVGNEFVRGVSGGERKRVSIAEMMATRARVQCWDNSTRGLDASTALDFCKSLRIMTDVLGQTTFVTL